MNPEAPIRQKGRSGRSLDPARRDFSDMPYFCRAYRARFDLLPSKDRDPPTSGPASTAIPLNHE